jgi:putative restriction endonuclease
VFSYANGRISQIGLVETAAVTAAKPPEFGATGDNWSQEGWLVRVNWQPLRQALVPQTDFELLQPLLPERHSPINTSTGRGSQGVYLAGLSETLGLLLLKLIEDHADPAVRVHLVVLAEEGEYTASLLDDMQRLREVPSSTERDALTKARLGQGLSRHRVAEREPACCSPPMWTSCSTAIGSASMPAGSCCASTRRLKRRCAAGGSRGRI